MNDKCQEIEELLAAYALDALDVDEKAIVERHLDTCDSCPQVLADYQMVTEGLLFAVPVEEPSAQLRAKLLTRTAPRPEKTAWFDRLRFPVLRWSNVLGVVAILMLVIFNISLLIRTNQLAAGQETLVQQNQSYQTAFALLTYPNSQVALIDDGTVYGTLVYDPDGRVAVLNMWGLGELSGEQDYQIWLIEPDENRFSGGVFNGSDDVAYVSVVIESPITFDAFAGIGITIEPEGGSPGPTGPRIVGIDL